MKVVHKRHKKEEFDYRLVDWSMVRMPEIESCMNEFRKDIEKRMIEAFTYPQELLKQDK
jgi:hypothetical protein